MAATRVLILDDEPNIGRSLQMILENQGYAVSVSRSLQEACVEAPRAHVMLLDVRLPDGSGIDLLRALNTANDMRAPVIMISGHGTIADAVEATRAGAFDFLEKPLSRDKVLLTLRKCAGTDRAARGERTAARAGWRGHAHDRVELLLCRTWWSRRRWLPAPTRESC